MNIHIAPGFDKLTNLMMEWLTNLTDSDSHGLFGANASRKELILKIEANADNHLLVVFYGHGAPSALLTETLLGSIPVEPDKAYLCDANDFNKSKRTEIFAYCCWSSLEMGTEIRNNRHGRYVGYRGELPFLAAPVVADAFEQPVREVVLRISREGGIYDDIINDLLSGYKAEHKKWLDGEHSEHDRSLMVCMFLEEHVRLLDRKI